MTRRIGLTRRDFVRATTGAAILGSAGIGASCQRLKSAPARPEYEASPSAATSAPSDPSAERKAPGPTSKVVLIRDPAVLGPGNHAVAEVLAGMLDRGVSTLLELPPNEAWSRLLKPEDVLGIKSNEWRFLRTPVVLEQMLVARARQVGIAADNISVDDRGVRSNPVFKRSTALINARPLRTHHWSGVGSCIKNYIMFSAAPPSWHADSCANLGGVWELPEVAGKTRLNILVMLTPLFHGKGPHHFNPEYTWPYAGLIIGQDPVAVDSVGVQILEAKRREHFGKAEPLTVPPKHVWVAQERYKLGVADPSRIEIRRVGDLAGALI